MAKVGLFGGSFNPVHLGHLVLAEQAREQLALERVLLVPNRLPPHKASATLAPAADRLHMVELAAAGNPALEASDTELHRDGASYSLHTVRGLLAEHPDWELHFLIGADTLPELPSWYRIRELAGLCRFAVANRPGAPLDASFDSLRPALTDAQVSGIRSRVIEIPPVGVSSSDIRRRLREGLSIRYLVPEPVRDYILEHRLYQIMKTALHFGAGKIGRGFLAQLYCQSGWETVFVDVLDPVVAALNQRGGYDIRLVDDAGTQPFAVTRVRAIHGRDIEAVADAVATCDLASTAVGVRVLPAVAAPLAAGLARRAARSGLPLNVVVCENLLDATETLRAAVLERLPDDAARRFVRDRVGFVASVVSRMVPDQPETADPLAVAVEPYAVLPVDATAFVGGPPPIQGFRPVPNIRAHEERKLFCHNLGHALAAYLGYQDGFALIADAVEDPPIRLSVLAGLAEAAQALIHRHGFEPAEYSSHVSDLLRRFANRALGDTVARVARDPLRKLGRHDRLLGAAQLCLDYAIRPTNILHGISAAFAYDNPDDPQAVQLQQMLREKGPDAVLASVCGLLPVDALYPLVRKVIAS